MSLFGRSKKSKKSKDNQKICTCADRTAEERCGCEAQKQIDMAIVEANEALKQKKEARQQLHLTDERLDRLEELLPLPNLKIAK